MKSRETYLEEKRDPKKKKWKGEGREGEKRFLSSQIRFWGNWPSRLTTGRMEKKKKEKRGEGHGTLQSATEKSVNARFIPGATWKKIK